MAHNIRKKTPTTFLSLPRELRHKILLLTYDVNDLHDQFHLRYSSWNRWYNTNKNYLNKWIVKLKKVHKDMVEDVEFVGRNWAQSLHDVREEFQELCRLEC